MKTSWKNAKSFYSRDLLSILHHHYILSVRDKRFKRLCRCIATINGMRRKSLSTALKTIITNTYSKIWRSSYHRVSVCELIRCRCDISHFSERVIHISPRAVYRSVGRFSHPSLPWQESPSSGRPLLKKGHL